MSTGLSQDNQLNETIKIFDSLAFFIKKKGKLKTQEVPIGEGPAYLNCSYSYADADMAYYERVYHDDGDIKKIDIQLDMSSPLNEITEDGLAIGNDLIVFRCQNEYKFVRGDFSILKRYFDEYKDIVQIQKLLNL